MFSDVTFSLYSSPTIDKALFQLKMHVTTMDQVFTNLQLEKDQVVSFVSMEIRRCIATKYSFKIRIPSFYIAKEDL